MDLSIVVPVYNEEKIIKKSLKKLSNFLASNRNYKYEIIIVNDGSIDSTAYHLHNIHEKAVKLIEYTPNHGKGYALKKGVNLAKGRVIYIADADLATPVSEIDKFLVEIKYYDCVIGSRAQKGSREKSSLIRVIAGKIGNKLINLLLNLNIKDTQCGFKMFRSELKPLFTSGRINGFGYDFEFLLKVEKNGYSIKELPIKWVAGEKSAVNFKSYFKTLFELSRIWWYEVGLSKKFVKHILSNTRTLQKYLLVGILTNLMNIGIFLFLLYRIKLSDLPIGSVNIPYYIYIETIAYSVAVFFNYILHKFFTFKSHFWKLKELLKYSMMLVINYLASITLLFLMIDILRWRESIAKFISLILVIMWNFIALKYFVYNS